METLINPILDIETVKTDLTELAQAYQEKEASGETEECEIIFEKMLQIGAAYIAQCGEQAEKIGEFKEFILSHTDESLYQNMLAYGLEEAITSVVSSSPIPPQEHEKEPDTFDEKMFKIAFISHVALRGVYSIMKSISPRGSATFQQIQANETRQMELMVEMVATLPSSALRTALNIVKEIFKTIESPLQTGPRQLRDPGERSFLLFYRQVRKEILFRKKQARKDAFLKLWNSQRCC